MFRNTIIDPNAGNRRRLGTTTTDADIALTCARNGMLSTAELSELNSKQEWQAYEHHICARDPIHFIPNNQADLKNKVQPIRIDHQPIYGPTAVGALRTQLNLIHQQSQHQQKAAAYTLDYNGFIHSPQPNEGLYHEPLPNIDWLA